MSRTPHRLASRLRFRDLQLLVALAEGSSLRKAAEVMNVTQPALSRTLTEMEDAFGCVLFLRGPRGLQPTSQGVAAMRGALQLLHELDRVDEEVEFSSQSASVIRLGAPPFVAHGHLPQLLAKLNRDGQAVRLKLMEGAVNDLFVKLLDGEVDALITTYADRVIEGERLVYDSLFPSRYVLIAPPEFQKSNRGKGKFSLGQLAELPWIMPGYTSMLRKDIDKAFLADGVTPPNPIVESNHPFTIAHFVAEGRGLSFVPTETLRNLKPGFVHEVPLTKPLTTGPVALIYRSGTQSAQLESVRQILGLVDKANLGHTSRLTRSQGGIGS